MDDPSAFRATGTVIVSTPARGVKSPCPPLLNRMCPADRASAEGRGFRGELPRFGTSYHKTPLAFAGSTGRSRVKVAEYSTLPRVFRGARRISLITALGASFRIEFAVKSPGQPHVLTTASKRLAAKRGRFATLNNHSDHAPLGERDGEQSHETEGPCRGRSIGLT